MPDLDTQALTREALAQMAATRDPRLREIMAAATRHLHDFAREVDLKPDEWLAGIAFLTAVGQACTPFHQEMILLSDVLGFSRLVNLLHDASGRDETGTESSLLGPFFREGAPEFAPGGSIAVHAAGGTEVAFLGTIADAEGQPVPDAEITVWQTDADGLYDLQAADADGMDMRGRFRADAAGRFHFRTVQPRGYSIPFDGPVGQLVRRQDRHGFRPAHIHVLIAAAGHRELVTALYFGDDAHIDSDTVFGVSPSLIVRPELDVAGSPLPGLPAIRYDFRLSRLGVAASGGRVGADPSRLMPAAG